MAVYVDELNSYALGAVSPAARKHGTVWCHMFADTLQELHAMARKLGLKRSWYQSHHASLPHYDLLPARRVRALQLGAHPRSVYDFLRAQRRKQPGSYESSKTRREQALQEGRLTAHEASA